MTTMVTDGKSVEWQHWGDFSSPEQHKRTKGQLIGKDLFGDKLPDYTVGFGRPRKGVEIDWHHDGDEFIYLIKGRLRIEDYDDGKTHIVKAGDLLFHKKGSRLKQIFEEDCEALVIAVPKFDPSVELPE